jgi:hypothetical protein
MNGMKRLLKNFSLISKLLFGIRYRSYLSVFVSLSVEVSFSQSINYINNGGFEVVFTVTSTPFSYPKYWGATDSVKFYGELLSKITSPPKVPLCSYTYQWPRHGNNHLISLQYCPTCGSNIRGYPRNRLKQVLKANTLYCFTMYVNLSNESSHAIDALQAYFGDNGLDTITQCNKPITYLIPQVSNAPNNIIKDTLNWIKVQGQFTANGTEKYAMIGNFKTDVATDTDFVNPAHSPPAIFGDYLIDDVSLIELNLPAFAGNDTVIFPGDSVYLGRERDVGIDDACLWYELPATTSLGTMAGFWVKPTITSTYVVRQEICGLIKIDTVTIYMNGVGIEKLKLLNENLKIYPVPAMDYFEIATSHSELFQGFSHLRIYNSLGQLIREEELQPTDRRVDLRTFENGAYLVEISNSMNEKVIKKLLINK